MEYVWLREYLGSLSPQDIEAVNSLLVRLSPKSPMLDMQDLGRISSTIGTHIVLAMDPAAEDLLIGMARLTEVPMLVGSEGVIADVVVDERYGGHGIGEALMQHLISRAREVGLRRLALVCWPENEAANHLYTSLGFDKLGVNYYRLKL